MDDFYARDFYDNNGNWHFCEKKSDVSLRRSAAIFVTYMVQHW